MTKLATGFEDMAAPVFELMMELRVAAVRVSGVRDGRSFLMLAMEGSDAEQEAMLQALEDIMGPEDEAAQWPS